MVRDRGAQGDQVGERHHRHAARAALARHGVRAAAPLHGRARRRVPRVGLRQRRQRLGERRDRRRRAGSGRGDPLQCSSRTECSSREGSAKGVVLEGGEEIRAKLVVSGADPRRTFLQLVGEKHLPDDFVDSIQRFRFRGSSAKVNLALGELPDFTCLPGRGAHLRGAISISPSVEYLERAYDDAKYGEISRRPYMDIVIPSMIDPSMAPPGKHVMSIFVQYAPYHVNGGWTDARREALGDAVVETLAAVRAEPEERDPAPAGGHAGRHRAHRRAGRRQHLPGRALAAADVLPAAGAGLGEVPHAARRPVPMRRRHASRRRRDGRLGPQRRASRSSALHEKRDRHRRRRGRAGGGADPRARRARSDNDRRQYACATRDGCRRRCCASCASRA